VTSSARATQVKAAENSARESVARLVPRTAQHSMEWSGVVGSDAIGAAVATAESW